MTPERETALELANGQSSTPKNIERVAKVVGIENARWAFNQWEIRKRAAQKFSKAEEMLFDRGGLEMSSNEYVVKNVNSSGFPSNVRIADLTCGIGADLIGLSDGRDAIGFELDLERAEYARHNLAVYGQGTQVVAGNCLDQNWHFDYAFADPARRSGGKRTLDPKQFSPPLDKLVERMRQLKLGVIKLSPMLSDEFLDSLSPDRRFVSYQGECKEVLVQVGTEPREGSMKGVWAIVEPGGHEYEGELPLQENLEEPFAFVTEADAAIIRAHALGNFKNPGLGDSNGYLTNDTAPKGSKNWFRVVWHGAYHQKDIKAALDNLSLRIDVVKSRGVDVDVQLVRKQLWNDHKQTATLFLYPVGKSVRALIALSP